MSWGGCCDYDDRFDGDDGDDPNDWFDELWQRLQALPADHRRGEGESREVQMLNGGWKRLMDLDPVADYGELDLMLLSARCDELLRQMEQRRKPEDPPF